MADEVRVWRVTEDDSLREIKASSLNREERIEQWIADDVSVLEPGESGLLIIGRQVRTDYDKEIDLLCINGLGDLVIVELKRDRTPRDVTAQALDYASWIKDLGRDKIEEIAAAYLRKHLKEAFESKFESDYPEVLNSSHSIKIVASYVDDSTERIIRYLSSYGIDINFVRFQMLSEEHGELLVRTFTVAPDEAEQNAKRSGNTKRTSSAKTLEEIMKDTENAAEADFLRRQLANARLEQSANHVALLFRSAGRIRFRMRARNNHVHVTQNGRFPEDEQFWVNNLSEAHLGYRRAKANLSFHLYTKEDFAFFEQQMIKSFQWSPGSVQSNDEPEDE